MGKSERRPFTSPNSGNQVEENMTSLKFSAAVFKLLITVVKNGFAIILKTSTISIFWNCCGRIDDVK